MNQKQENVVGMIKTMKGMLDELPESKLKQEFGRFLHMMVTESAPFKTILMVLEKNTNQNTQMVNQDTVNTPKMITSFWKKVQKLVIDTYKENR